MLPKINPTQTNAWKKLTNYYRNYQLSAADATTVKLESCGLTYDFSKSLVSDEAFSYLVELAQECKLSEATDGLFSGEHINETENRAVLHTALRQFSPTDYLPNAIYQEVTHQRNRLKSFVEEIQSGARRNSKGQAFKHVVNIGIGGSDLGLRMAYRALKPYKQSNLQLHFINSIDAQQIEQLLQEIPVEDTLFVVVSKSFSTKETLSNAQVFKDLCKEKLGTGDWQKHFAGVTVHPSAAAEFGILSEHTFLFWDWVCGRFSMCSSVGLGLALGLGYEVFERILRGAEKADQHFKNTPFEENIPVRLALNGIAYTNFLGAQTEAILPYSELLGLFPAYLQQVAMESNGKRIDRNGQLVSYATAPIVWGDLGNNAQHSFFQLLHQGSWLVPADFIMVKHYQHPYHEHQLQLAANCYAQTEALFKGKPKAEVLQQLQDKKMSKEDAQDLLPHKIFPGNKPSTLIEAEKLTPEALGAMCSFYEHKYFVQGIIWNIYSFDQWGVELGKELALNWEQQLKK